MLTDEKRRLRSEIRSEISSLVPEYLRAAGGEICRRILALEEYGRARNVFCFVSDGREPDTYPLLRHVLKSGRMLCVPLCVKSGEMEARRVKNLDELSPGYRGIAEPPAESERVDISCIDLAIVPCLACGRDGARLGKGGGYYDRFLAAYKGKSILVCPERLIKTGIPMDAHDIYVPMVMTEDSLFINGCAAK